jgi:hypothetical protein
MSAQPQLRYLRREGTDLIFVETEALKQRRDMFPYHGPVPFPGPVAPTVDEQRIREDGAGKSEDVKRTEDEATLLEQFEKLRQENEELRRRLTQSTEVQAEELPPETEGAEKPPSPMHPRLPSLEAISSAREQMILDAVRTIPKEAWSVPGDGRPLMPKIRDVRIACGFEVGRDELIAVVRRIEESEQQAE